MKNTKTCPKCNSSDIVRIDGYSGPYGTGNNIMTKNTIFSAVNVNRYICCECGYTEEWIDREDIEKVKNSKKAIVMSAFDNSEFEKYKAEAQEKWGKTDAYKQHEERTRHYSKQKWNDLTEEMDHIMSEFASCMRKVKRPDSTEAQSLVKMLQNHITKNYYLCTNEILTGLGQMYLADERFKNNIDKHANGTATFICEAIEVYCRK